MIKSQFKNLIKSSFQFNNKSASKSFLYTNTLKSKDLLKTNILKRNFCEKKDTKKDEEFISFGYKNVKKEERQDMVNEVFANVASR